MGKNIQEEITLQKTSSHLSFWENRKNKTIFILIYILSFIGNTRFYTKQKKVPIMKFFRD